MAVQSERYTLAMFHLVLMGFIPKNGTAIAGIKEKMSYRFMLRRGRRGRRIDRSKVFKFRNHRQKRFSNRKKAKLPPSIRSNRQLEIRVISELSRIYPITTIRVEKVRADVDKTSGRKGAKSGKGGNRERYGGSTTPFEARKGDLIEYTTKSKGKIKKVIGYCSGYTGNSLSLSDANWSRLGRFANSKCRILARNTGLVISGGLTPIQLLSYPSTTKALAYGRSTSEAS
jgi:RRXRR protein